MIFLCSIRGLVYFRVLIAIVCFGIGMNVSAENLKQNNKHVRDWNNFANNAYKLHKKQIDGKNITIKKRQGGYANNPNFYLEKEYFTVSGKLLSRVSWEIKNPLNMHTIEVFVYNEKKQLVRDYVAAFLPSYRNAPNQTLISLHHYNKGLHAFRSFDATGDTILERCEGTYNGKAFSLLLDEDEIYESIGDDSSIMATKEYKQCFSGIPESAGRYLTPQ